MKKINVKSSKLALCLALLPWAAIFPNASFSQSSSTILNTRLGEIMAEDSLPSISVAVSKRAEIVYANALGIADLENQVSATTDTVYQIGSITKTFTAVAALQLVEQGKLSLSRPIQDYCEVFPAKQSPITSYQLLSHTAGVRHYDYRRFDEDFLNKVHYNSISEALSKFADDPLVSDPGVSYFYSSWGYVLTGCVVEGASSLSYRDLIRANIIDKANLSQTEFDVVSNIVPNRARGYSMSDSGDLNNVGLFDASDRYPAGGILSTPTDLVRYVNAILSGELLEDESLLSR